MESSIGLRRPRDPPADDTHATATLDDAINWLDEDAVAEAPSCWRSSPRCARARSPLGGSAAFVAPAGGRRRPSTRSRHNVQQQRASAAMATGGRRWERARAAATRFASADGAQNCSSSSLARLSAVGCRRLASSSNTTIVCRTRNRPPAAASTSTADRRVSSALSSGLWRGRDGRADFVEVTTSRRSRPPRARRCRRPATASPTTR